MFNVVISGVVETHYLAWSSLSDCIAPVITLEIKKLAITQSCKKETIFHDSEKNEI